MRKLLLLAAATVALSCGSEQQSVVVVNTNPLGTVGGMVIEAGSEMPLMGAMITIVVAGQTYTGTSDASGLFSVGNVPSGINFQVTIANSGYQSALVTGNLTGSVGNFPVKDPVSTIGTVGLIKNDGTFAFKVVDQFGAPVPMVPVSAMTSLRYFSYTNGNANAQGQYQVSATSGTDGIVALAGLPNYTALGSLAQNQDTLFITIAPMQVMGSTTIYTFLGGTFSFSVAHLENNGVVDQPIIRLAGPNSALTILNSNLDILRGLQANGNATITQFGAAGPDTAHAGVYTYTGPNGPITIEFNMVINKATLRAQLYDELGQQSTIALSATGSNNLLTITPMSALTAGTRYNLGLHVDAATTAGVAGASRELNVTVPIFTAPTTGSSAKVLPASTKYTVDPSANVFVDIVFSEPIGIGFGSTAAVSCVAYYELMGAGLDNGATALAPGEWPIGSTTGIGTTCPALGGTDITAIASSEAVTGMPNSGFSTRWRVKADVAGHTECVVQAGCQFPSPPPTMHLLFSHLPANQTFKRPDGTPVADNLMNFSFTPALAGP